MAYGNEAAREQVVRWDDPREGLAMRPHVDGLEYLQRMVSGAAPQAAMASHIRMRLVTAERGSVTFVCEPDESHSNMAGAVHGGLLCTLLDSALGSAVLSTLPAGASFASIEIKVSFLRPVTVASGPLTCLAKVVKPGRRVAFAEGEVRDAANKVVATASGALLVMPLEEGAAAPAPQI